jgi:hypothetical protein
MKPIAFLRGLLTLVLLCCCGSVFADGFDNWHWRNPLPNGNPPAGPHALYGVVFANGKFVGAGDSGTVSISPDGTNWTESATATTNTLNAIIYGGGLFLAVGDGGAVETSTDGMNWMLRASGTTNSLAAAAFANGIFVAVGGNAVITSSDAANWSPVVSGLTGATGVAGGSAGFVAIGGGSQVFFSADGSIWTSQQLTTVPDGSSGFGFPKSMVHWIVTYYNGGYLIGSSRYVSSMSVDTFMFSSTDGNSWTTNGLGNVSAGIYGFHYLFFMSGGGNVIAAGRATFSFLQFSSEGINWTTVNNLPTVYNTFYDHATSGAYGNGVYVMPAVIGGSLPPIFTSTDGLTWVNQQHPPTPPVGPTDVLSSITFSNGTYITSGAGSIVRSTNGLLYVTVSNSPALVSVTTFGTGFIGAGSGGKIYQSGDGLSWTQRNSGTASNLRGITSGGGLLVAVGDNGAIQTSATGTIWTSRSSGTSLPLYGVAYAGGLFVAVGQLGTVLTSPDGISWTGQDSGQLMNLLSVTHGPAGFLAVGQGGTILTSPDGINWKTQSSGTAATLESIAFGNGYYLAAGDNATALTSPDGITWTTRNPGATGGQNFYGAAFLNNRFDVVGAGGTILESDLIVPLFDLQIHPGGNWITAYVPMGSNFRIQTSTSLAAPVWSDASSFFGAPAITQWTNSSTGLNQLFYRAVSP